MDLKILFLRSFPKHDMEFLRKHLSKYYKFIIPKDFSVENLSKLAKDADIFICNKLSKKLIEPANNLKVVQVPGAGVNGIDLKSLKDRQIVVCNSHSNTQFVAEYAAALMFSLVKQICLRDREMRNGIWFRPKNDDHILPYLIHRKTIGFLGFGNMAQRIASCLSSFQCEFLAFNKSGHKYKKNVDNLPKINFTNLKSILSKSDIVFITLPLTEKTKGLINLEEIKLMKKTAYLINVSRGAVIPEEDLYLALKEKRIAGAAVDVWYDDIYHNKNLIYPSKKYPFHELENIILSPYFAAITEEKSTHLKDVVENLKLFAEEGKLINIVDKNNGY